MERERRAPAAAAALWGHKHLHLLARAGSKESLEYILQALWRTRRTGLDAADRAVVRDALQLASYAEIDPVSTPTYLFSSPAPPFRAVAVMPSRLLRVQNVQCPQLTQLCSSSTSAAAARVPEDTDQAVRQRGRLQGRHPQALPRRGAARVAEAAHVTAAEVPARVAGGCFKGSGEELTR